MTTTEWLRTQANLRRPVSVALVAVVLASGLAGSWVAANAVRDGQRLQLSELSDQRAQAVKNAVVAEARRYTDTITDLAFAAGAQSDLSAEDFAEITAGTSRERLPGATAVLLVVAADKDQVGQVQAYWRAAGNRELTVNPVGVGREHLFVVLNHTLDGTTPVTGRDLTGAVEPTEALLLARSSGQVTASRTYVLLKDRNLPPAQRQMSFTLAAPVYGGGGTPDAGQFRGWIVMGLRGSDFIAETLHTASQRMAVVTLSDASTPTAVPVARVADGTVINDAGLRREAKIGVGGRTWHLTVEPTTDIRSSLNASIPDLTGGIGALLSVLLAALIGILSTSRNRALSRVDRATAELRADIERREHVEAQLRERETELEAFAEVAAHDLKAPLTTLTGYTEILTDDYAGYLDGGARRCLQKMSTATARMRRLIDDLLTYATARDGALDPQPVDLTGLVTDILSERYDPTADAPHVDLGQLPTVVGDPVLLRQVMDNLIGNVIKYVRPNTAPYLSITAQPTDDGWRIEVTDRGIGIAEADHNAVFGTFHRARGSEGYPGTGLGLAICKRVINRHGGTIGVATNPDGGSRFWFTIPNGSDRARTGQRASQPPSTARMWPVT